MKEFLGTKSASLKADHPQSLLLRKKLLWEAMGLLKKLGRCPPGTREAADHHQTPGHTGLLPASSLKKEKRKWNNALFGKCELLSFHGTCEAVLVQFSPQQSLTPTAAQRGYKPPCYQRKFHETFYSTSISL